MERGGRNLALADSRSGVAGSLADRSKRSLLLSLAAVVATLAFLALGAQPAHAASPKALILSDSVSVPGPPPAAASGESLEQYEAEQDGFVVTNVDGTQWDAMTGAQFAQYQVVIIGDPTCGFNNFQAAVTNESTWEPVVMSSGGNKVLIGTDPTYHTYGGHPGDVLEKNGIAFAGAQAGATGAYVDLSCTYSSASPGTPVPLLDGLSTHGPGSFTAGGAPCAGSISIVTASGPTSGLHDADLANWECSVHNFFDKFPADYTPLALATDPSVPKTYTGTDVDTGASVSGSPYIMVSGSGVVVKSELTLTPPSQTLAQGGSASVAANLKSGGSNVSGASVEFDITSGPNSGKTFTGTTDPSGNTTFTYTDTGGAGTDQIVGTNTSSGVTSQGTATVTWSSADTAAPTCKILSIVTTPTSQKENVTVQDTGSGLASIFGIMVTNGTVSVPPFTVGTTSPVVVTASKTNLSKTTKWSFHASDVAGNTMFCN
jgi:hypothetical protein